MDKHYEYSKDLHGAFMDFKQVYDSVNREILWETYRRFDIPMEINKMIQLCNSETHIVD